MSAPGVAFERVQVGDRLPELSVELTTTLIVAGALASRDFTPVHHDKAAAQAQGMQDVFMNILTTNGFVGRYVTDWAGADATIRRVAIRLGAPNLPGDTLRLAGRVTARHEPERLVEVEVVGRNAWGEHVSGTVTVALPVERAGHR
jgi:acyl dehydratase